MDTSTVEIVAHELLTLTRQSGFDPTMMRSEITAVVQPFVVDDSALTELFTAHGMTIEGAENSRTVFYSPELIFVLSKFRTDFILPTHNHYMWNFLVICKGAMHFRWFRRLDDGSVPGRSQVEVGEDVVVRTGEVAFIAPPPHDIHELAIIEDGTWMLTVTPMPEPPDREIYDVAAGTYEFRRLGVADRAMV